MGLNARLFLRLLGSAAFVTLAAITIFDTSGPASASVSTDRASDVGRPSLPPGSIEVAVLDAVAFGLLPPQPPGDVEYLSQVLQAYRSGDMIAADILKSKLTQPAARAVAEWFAIRSGVPVGFDRIMAFQRSYLDWPTTTQTRRRAEGALLKARGPSSLVRAFFAEQPPQSGAGRIALAFALKVDGLAEKATPLIRQIWREDSFGPELENRIREQFPGVLTQADHRFRMERLLFKKSWSAAMRAAEFAGSDHATLVKARMAAVQGGKKAEKALEAVPAALRRDSSYIFSRALFLRRKNKLIEAAKIMAEAPRDPELLVDGDEWWSERRLIARALLDKGGAKAAYEVASHHGAETPVQRIEAEFHAGWIALRFLGDPTVAAKHFAEAANIAATPISVSRAAYWQGRAAEAAGLEVDARRFYRRAADKPITYYGQLARKKLGLPVELRTAERLSQDDNRAFQNRLPMQALRLLHRIDEVELAIGLYAELAQTLTDAADLDALAAMAAGQANLRAALVVGKTAVQRGFPLDLHAYPTFGFPKFEPVGDQVEPAMVYAVARQESAFNPKALSSAGARGLMQLMPETAKRTAKRFGLNFDVKRLTEDPAYNAALGSAHLGELMENWKGSFVLAFASYNAGAGNVMKWIKTYGDPRKPSVDMIDWIERIPFSETRNYVQRVMENLTVYRRRFEGGDEKAKAAALRPFGRTE